MAKKKSIFSKKEKLAEAPIVKEKTDEKSVPEAEEKTSDSNQVESVKIDDVAVVSAVVRNGVAIVKGKTADGKSFDHEMVMKNRYGTSFSLK